MLLRRPDIPTRLERCSRQQLQPASAAETAGRPAAPVLSDKELIVEVLRQNPGLTVEEILAEAKFHGWDLDPTGVQLPPNTSAAAQRE